MKQDNVVHIGIDVAKDSLCISTGTPGTVTIDVWNNYHCACGEGHGGTAATREMPATPWWEQPAIQNKWKDEQ